MNEYNVLENATQQLLSPIAIVEKMDIKDW